MKIFIKLLILLLILACAAPFFIKGPNGELLMNFNNFKLPELSIPSIDSLKDKVTPSISRENIKVYKWRDEKGVINYSDQQNPDRKGKLIQIKSLTILPATATSDSQLVENKTDKIIDVHGLTTVPLGDVPKLINDAKQIGQLLKERKQHQDTMINSIN